MPDTRRADNTGDSNMSTKQHANPTDHTPHNTTAQFNSDRMVTRAYNTLDSIAAAFEQTANNAHQSIVLDKHFWDDLQAELTLAAAKYCALFTDSAYTAAARELMTVKTIAIRTAIEEFRTEARQYPAIIHRDAAWNAFRAAIRHHATTASRATQ